MKPDATPKPSARPLSGPAARALAEAEARREAAERAKILAPPPPREIDGREGLEPVRYGDWEVNGLARDF
jgi:hypothetical protein